MIANPTEDLPSTDSETCDLAKCHEPWAWEADEMNGPRPLRLCERHATIWLEMGAEMVRVA